MLRLPRERLRELLGGYEFYAKDECKSEGQGVAEVIVGKQRNGPTGTVRLAFLGQYTKFENLAAGRDNDERQ